jgi:hypothetical protein
VNRLLSGGAAFCPRYSWITCAGDKRRKPFGSERLFSLSAEIYTEVRYEKIKTKTMKLVPWGIDRVIYLKT